MIGGNNNQHVYSRMTLSTATPTEYVCIVMIYTMRVHKTG